MNCNCRGNREEYLLVSSCHPQHTKRAIPFSLALRLRRICSNPDNYKLRTKLRILLIAAMTKPFLGPVQTPNFS